MRSNVGQAHGVHRLRALFLQLGSPVQEDGHGRGVRLFHWCADQKALAIATHVIEELVIE